jgi:hypothetical protein
MVQNVRNWKANSLRTSKKKKSNPQNRNVTEWENKNKYSEVGVGSAEGE